MTEDVKALLEVPVIKAHFEAHQAAKAEAASKRRAEIAAEQATIMADREAALSEIAPRFEAAKNALDQARGAARGPACL